jgi:hypothetical protein
MFFFEKKNQKTFIHWRVRRPAYTPTDKSFLLLFFKKEDPSLHSMVK